MSVVRILRRLANFPRSEYLTGPTAEQVAHKLGFDFGGGKWMYM